MKDIDINGDASKPNSGACHLARAAFKSAYKALTEIDINSCNKYLKAFLFENAQILPGETADLIRFLHAEKYFEGLELDFRESKMFDLSYHNWKKLNAIYLRYLNEINHDIKPIEECCYTETDDRFERIGEALLEIAEIDETRLRGKL